jgi:hypothetical protein
MSVAAEITVTAVQPSMLSPVKTSGDPGLIIGCASSAVVIDVRRNP